MSNLLERYRAIMDPAASLEVLAGAFPGEWHEVQTQAKTLIKNAQSEAVSAHLVKARAVIDSWNQKLKASTKPQNLLAEALPQIAKARLLLLTLESWYRRALAQGGGRAPSRFDHFVANTLFFNRQRQRRCPSHIWFQSLWPLVRQKSAISALLQGMGIYCVFSRQFGRELKRLINGRTCLEVGAGDGTLTLLLDELGVSAHATDDYSWQKRIRYPEWVEKLTAQAALEHYAPRVVVCSWPPPDNQFEEKIFATKSVELYVAIVSKHRYAAGNWQAYESQGQFVWQAEARLSRLLLPKEWEHQVLVFRRAP